MSEKKEKQSSWLLNLFMLIVGAMTIFLAVVYYITFYFGLTLPSWWPFVGLGTLTFLMLVGSLPVGAWMLIGSIGLWKEKAWALGVAFVCFTLILANGLWGTIQYIMNNLTTFYLDWFCWIAIIMVTFSGVGLIYLIATHNRYH
ncbi:MAG: hypothetical protein Q6373_014215 [Candidatus Sigynarchaeota archaeon]